MAEDFKQGKNRKVTFDNVPDYATAIYGREKEFSQIEGWIVQDRCRLISILGMGGIGKTALALKVARENQENFDFIIWRSLIDAPPVEDILQGLLDFLSVNDEEVYTSDSKDIFANVFYFLKKYRCLIVLDNAEVVTSTQIYQGYEKLLGLVIEDLHQSCLILTSREGLNVVKKLEKEETKYVKSFALTGLSVDDGLKILQELELDLSLASDNDWKDLIEFYGGNPLALQLVGRNLASFWDGSISEFLEYSRNNANSTHDFTIKIKDILDNTFQRLPSPEKRILYLLAINSRALTLEEIEREVDDRKEKTLIKEIVNSLCSRSLIERSISVFRLHPLTREYSNRRLINHIFEEQNFGKGAQDPIEKASIVRSIEFPPEYREAGTSILMYFNHVLKLKYPDVKVKVRIEQDGLILRMIIHTPSGHKESVERTIQEYGMVVTGQLPAELFLSDPFEVMALKNKLEIASLELRQTRELLNFTQNNSQKRVESLEVEVDRLHRLIERSLQSKDTTLGVIEKMTRQEGKSYDLRGAKFGGGFATEGGLQTGGSLIDASSTNNLSEAALQIQELLQQLQTQGSTSEEAQQKVASDLARQAESDPSVMGKLVNWGKSLADTAGKTTVSEATKGVVKLALQIAGIPIP
jgi:polyhydroxyalkanoate synthesis regulator phasin